MMLNSEDTLKRLDDLAGAPRNGPVVREMRALIQSLRAPAPDHRDNTIDALTGAEAFIEGFEDDETQEGVPELLASLRAAIQRAQALAKWTGSPAKNFVEGNWSFRFGIDAMTKRHSFTVIPKGARFMGHHSSRADLDQCSDGKTWRFTVIRGGVGRGDARPTFAEARACALKLLNAKEA